MTDQEIQEVKQKAFEVIEAALENPTNPDTGVALQITGLGLLTELLVEVAVLRRALERPLNLESVGHVHFHDGEPVGD